MADDTRVDLLVRRIKDHKWLSLAVVAGIAFLAIISILKGLQDANSIYGKLFPSDGLGMAPADPATKEAIVSAAHDVDLFLLKIESSPGKVPFADLQPEYVRIEAELQSIRLRSTSKALNMLPTQLSEELLKQWDDVGKLLQLPGGVPPDSVKFVRDSMFQMFNDMLRIEEAKKASSN
jgi:hypothetical protein